MKVGAHFKGANLKESADGDVYVLTYNVRNNAITMEDLQEIHCMQGGAVNLAMTQPEKDEYDEVMSEKKRRQEAQRQLDLDGDSHSEEPKPLAETIMTGDIITSIDECEIADRIFYKVFLVFNNDDNELQSIRVREIGSGLPTDLTKESIDNKCRLATQEELHYLGLVDSEEAPIDLSQDVESGQDFFSTLSEGDTIYHCQSGESLQILTVAETDAKVMNAEDAIFWLNREKINAECTYRSPEDRLSDASAAEPEETAQDADNCPFCECYPCECSNAEPTQEAETAGLPEVGKIITRKSVAEGQFRAFLYVIEADEKGIRAMNLLDKSGISPISADAYEQFYRLATEEEKIDLPSPNIFNEDEHIKHKRAPMEYVVESVETSGHISIRSIEEPSSDAIRLSPVQQREYELI